MNNLDSFSFTYSIRSRDAAAQCKLSASVLSILVAVYFFFLKKDIFTALMIKQNFNDFEHWVSISNGVFVAAIVLSIASVITGYLGLDKEALLNLTETYKAKGVHLTDNEKKQSIIDFESKIMKSEKNSGISMLLSVASIIFAVLAILILILQDAKWSVIYGVGGGGIAVGLIIIASYFIYPKPKKKITNTTTAPSASDVTPVTNVTSETVDTNGASKDSVPPEN